MSVRMMIRNTKTEHRVQRTYHTSDPCDVRDNAIALYSNFLGRDLDLGEQFSLTAHPFSCEVISPVLSHDMPSVTVSLGSNTIVKYTAVPARVPRTRKSAD